MIDQKFEYLYDIILSIFLGILCAVLFDNMFEKPRIVNIYFDENDKNDKNDEIKHNY